MKRAFAVAVAALLLPVVVLLAAAVGVLGGGTDAVIPVAGGGAAGLAVAAAQAGFTGQGLRLAVAVGLAESGGDPTARNPNPPTPGCPGGSLDRGGWQLNTCYHTEVSDACADDLACAAEQTYQISAAGSDWSAWTTYTSGAYRAQLGAADQAIATLATPSVDGGEIPPGFGTPGPCGAVARHRLHQASGHRVVRDHRHRRLCAVLRPCRKQRPLPGEAREFGITDGALAGQRR